MTIRALDRGTVDSLVAVKPGGESDGTTDGKSARFSGNCYGPDAKQPAPEAGEQCSEFAEMLVRMPNPPLKPTWCSTVIGRALCKYQAGMEVDVVHGKQIKPAWW